MKKLEPKNENKNKGNEIKKWKEGTEKKKKRNNENYKKGIRMIIVDFMIELLYQSDCFLLFEWLWKRHNKNSFSFSDSDIQFLWC